MSFIKLCVALALPCVEERWNLGPCYVFSCLNIIYSLPGTVPGLENITSYTYCWGVPGTVPGLENITMNKTRHSPALWGP